MIAPHELPTAGPAAAFAAQLQSSLPRLQTERLVLRAPRLEDFSVYVEIATGPRGSGSVENIDTRALWLDFTQAVATWLLRGHGVWGVESRADGELLGFVVLGFEPGDVEPELGYLFRQRAEGRGYAAEAARAARAHAVDTLGIGSLISTIAHDNIRSRNLAERLGAARDPQAEAAYDGRILVYRHPVPEVRT